MARTTNSETVMLADEVEMTMTVEYFDSEACDTCITIDGSFFVDGEKRNEFAEKMQALVNEYLV